MNTNLLVKKKKKTVYATDKSMSTNINSAKGPINPKKKKAHTNTHKTNHQQNQTKKEKKQKETKTKQNADHEWSHVCSDSRVFK